MMILINSYNVKQVKNYRLTTSPASVEYPCERSKFQSKETRQNLKIPKEFTEIESEDRHDQQNETKKI